MCESIAEKGVVSVTDRELQRLSRADLLEMLIEVSEELNSTKEKLQQAEADLKKREIIIDRAGSIAEASLQLNGVFEAAEAAGAQYMENIRTFSDRQDEICRRIELECREKARLRLEEVEKRCMQMEADTKVRCAEMQARAKAEAQVEWKALATRLDAFYEEHKGLRELLAATMPG